MDYKERDYQSGRQHGKHLGTNPFRYDKNESQRGTVACFRSQLAKLEIKPGLMSLSLDFFISFGISPSIFGKAIPAHSILGKILYCILQIQKEIFLILVLSFLNFRE